MYQYFFVNAKNGMCIGMDQDSGGYPYETSYPGSVHFWTSKKDAEYYYSMFPDEDWILHKFYGFDSEVVK